MKTIVLVTAAALIALAVIPARASDCAIVGDSIAADLGIEGRLGCAVNAKIGIPSGAIIARVPGGHVRALVISAGSNDPANPHLAANLEAIRARANADRVVWVLPIAGRPRAAVASVAAKHGDRAVSFAPAGDHVHPKNNHVLAAAVRAVW